MLTHSTLTQMLIEAHANDLINQAQQARLTRAARAPQRPPDRPSNRLRTRTAQLLVGLARRLDDRLVPIPGPATVSGSSRRG